MKQYLLLIVCCFFAFVSYGQISHGGQPLFPTPQLKTSLLKNSSDGLFVEMPSFNVDKLREEDRMNEQDLRGGFRFANKFITNIERGVSGLNYQLDDGTKVWQVGIRSEGAYSINVLFGEFNIPEGGKLFLYNSNRTHVIGSFTRENNLTGNNILPTQPVEGDEIIIEYSEPANASFPGKLRITEVNHDYLNIFLRSVEPEIDQVTTYPCMPDALCSNSINNENIRSTVLLIINGASGCTGTLVNNTKNDGTPYLITAVHCLNSDPAIERNMDYYLEKSGTIVTFFNYQRSICNSEMRGVESQTIAGSTALAIVEKKDVALLRLNETPPDYYNPYYSGWNIEQDGGSNPHTNLHHPNKTLKKAGFINGNLSLVTSPFIYFDALSHWKVSWTNGATDGGSSGSPLFDASGLLIGGLSGGNSICSGKNSGSGSDYFFALCKSWEYGVQDSVNLKHWLDPGSEGTTQLPGLDPFKDYPMVRLSNADYNASIPDTLTATSLGARGSGFLFGHNSLQETNEFAEAFNVESEAELVGTFLMLPPISNFSGTVSPIKINIYTGENGPEIPVVSVLFNPTYVTYNTSKKGFENNSVTLSGGKGSENFVFFPGNHKVSGNFYVSYEISYPSSFNFSVYNTAFGSKKKNSAWVKKISGEWFAADKYPGQSITTSLAIQPVIIQGNKTEEETLPKPNIATYDRQSKILYIHAEAGETGTATIYTTTGQSIRTFAFAGSQSFSVSAPQKGTIGIVKVVSNNRNSAIKIIF